MRCHGFRILFSAARAVEKCHNSGAVWSARSTMAQHVAHVPAGNERSSAHSIFLLAQLFSATRGMEKYEDFMQSVFHFSIVLFGLLCGMSV